MTGLGDTTNEIKRKAKAGGRKVLDRALLPYFSELGDRLDGRVAEGAPQPAPEGGNPAVFFHGALHGLRTLELESIEKGAKSALSVGASGAWYFQWFENHYGPLERHVGVEAFEPKPDDLPDFAEWVESSADSFEGVEAGSIDLVFAGQTTEHLWADEIHGFLLESHRVLSDGGLLVADSPNRLVTQYLHWSHGGHTIELSAAEWSELLVLAGFDAIRTRGAWLCEFGDKVWQLEEGLDDPQTLIRRATLAGENPDESFIWWIDARKSKRKPKVQKLRERIDALFAEHWDTRISRGMWPGPGSDGPVFAQGDLEPVSSTLPIMLHEGTWRVTVAADQGSLDDLIGLRLVVRMGDAVQHDLRSPWVNSDGSMSWEFVQDKLQLALTIEVRADEAKQSVRLAMPISLTPEQQR